MSRNSDEKDFRLRPRKPTARRGSGESIAWARAFKTVIHYARASHGPKASASGMGAGNRRATTSRNQRCAIRVTYAGNSIRGQWRAHGRYVARERAAGIPSEAGFDRSSRAIDIGDRLDYWQTAGDQRLWKIIISPEFGDRLDLTRLTRDLMSRIEHDLESDLEWVAVAHFNTEHPHVHVAMRGVSQQGRPLVLKREYVKRGIRAISEDLCTRQLGHRTDLDAAEAERREVRGMRFTSLDRLIVQAAGSFLDDSSNTVSVTVNPANKGDSERAQAQRKHIAARLAVLEDMGLARRAATNSWEVRRDLERTLRAMQRVNDRQKMIAAHGALMSDERLPVESLDWRKARSVEGRLLVHGEDETSGRGFLFLEGTDACVHLIDYTPEIEHARSQGRLRPNSFVRLRRVFGDDGPVVECADFGDSEAILHDRQRLQRTARDLVRSGILPTDDGWGGWLGRYQRVLREAAMELEYPVRHHGPQKQRDRALSR